VLDLFAQHQQEVNSRAGEWIEEPADESWYDDVAAQWDCLFKNAPVES
jgi:hypothetical protein